MASAGRRSHAFKDWSSRTRFCCRGRGMSTSKADLREALAESVSISDDALMADLTDGRTITVPLAWFPRLAHGTAIERANWRLIAGGAGIHWPDLDEDISVESLLAGRRSGEAQESLRRSPNARISALTPQRTRGLLAEVSWHTLSTSARSDRPDRSRPGCPRPCCGRA